MTFNNAGALVLSFGLMAAGMGGAWGSETASPPAPTTTVQSTRGMTHTISAEPLGAGRLCFSLLGGWYGQDRAFPGVPSEGSQIIDALLGFSFGVNSAIDIFAFMPAYILVEPDENDPGAGSFTGGIQGSLPLPAKSPLRLGAQLAVIAGTASNQINHNQADGYNYFLTRTGFDFQGRLNQSLVFGEEVLGIKFHLNEGAVFSVEDGRDHLLLLSGGVQGILHRALVLGLEVNSRTGLQKSAFDTDPLWLTPSVQIRTPYYFTFTLGADVSLSQDRIENQQRALEPFRLFGGFVFSFDALEGRRRQAAEKEKREAEEKAAAQRKAEEEKARADSLANKAKADSLALAEELARAREAERQRAEEMAQKAREDSIALAETKRKLAEEVSKRSDAEKQLLSTGLLLLDAVYFETGKAEISINSRPYLNIIGKMLTKYPKLQIEVSGHTDNVGSYEKNLQLSQNRADAVKIYLISVAPELAGRVTARGYGPSQPKADNATADGRKVNRRVELQVLNKDALREYNQ